MIEGFLLKARGAPEPQSASMHPRAAVYWRGVEVLWLRILAMPGELLEAEIVRAVAAIR